MFFLFQTYVPPSLSRLLPISKIHRRLRKVTVDAFEDCIWLLSSNVLNHGLSRLMIDEAAHLGYYRTYARQLRRLLDEERPGIVHAHGFKMHLLSGLARSLWRGREPRSEAGYPPPPPSDPSGEPNR